jgi:ribosomal protein S18 acetylase RimI-like enzyme
MRRGRAGMANHALGTDSPSEIGQQPDLRDAQILVQALRASVITSPDAFSKNLEDVENPELDYWRKEIDSATWAVIQRGEEVIGVAVARRPDLEMDSETDPIRARFIESVWIAPEFRRLHLGDRLVRCLMEEEHAKDPCVRQFLLWVFDDNKLAIAMYEHMGFLYAGRQEFRGWRGENKPKYELKYKYDLDPGCAEMQDAAAGRREDVRRYGLVYRLLGEGK